MQIARRHLMPIVLVLLAAFAAVPAARAQDPPMDAAATEIADAITHAKQKSVIVLDFSGPDSKITPLGQKLAGDFSAALAKSAAKIRVEDRSQVPGAIKANSYPLDFVNWGELTLAFVQDLHVQAFVMGGLSVENNRLSVVVSAYRSDNGKNIKAIRVAWPISDEEKAMMAENLANVTSARDPNDLRAVYPKAGANGSSYPTCLYCPRAVYSPDAMNRKIQGTVELEAVVGEDGRISDIRVLKPLPFGLTTSAIETVKTWKLKPATGPDGKPVAVRQIIEIGFGLN
jgi:TonB family protein